MMSTRQAIKYMQYIINSNPDDLEFFQEMTFNPSKYAEKAHYIVASLLVPLEVGDYIIVKKEDDCRIAINKEVSDLQKKEAFQSIGANAEAAFELFNIRNIISGTNTASKIEYINKELGKIGTGATDAGYGLCAWLYCKWQT